MDLIYYFNYNDYHFICLNNMCILNIKNVTWSSSHIGLGNDELRTWEFVANLFFYIMLNTKLAFLTARILIKFS